MPMIDLEGLAKTMEKNNLKITNAGVEKNETK